jgi:hypothetical protein
MLCWTVDQGTTTSIYLSITLLSASFLCGLGCWALDDASDVSLSQALLFLVPYLLSCQIRS